MMLLQKYLREGNTFEALLELGVKTRRHSVYNNLMLFKYDIGANFSIPMVQECRGVVLDETDNWNVVCRAFDKFFNLGEFYAAEIDWTTAKVQEKLDGSLCTMYYYNGGWHVATSGTPDACGEVHSAGGTFADYFWKTFLAEDGMVPLPGRESLCFSFELMGPDNQIVVVHKSPSLRLIGVRDRLSGTHLSVDEYASHVNISAVRSFESYSADQLHQSFETMSPVEQEGYVVVDSAFRRVKVKHPGYVALHHLGGSSMAGPKAFMQVVRTGEISEVLNSHPHIAMKLFDAKLQYDKFLLKVYITYDNLKDIPVQKDFAIEATKTNFSTCLFQMRRGKALTEFLRDVPIDTLMKWLE